MPKISTICPRCNKTFEHFPSVYRVFCSKDCHNKGTIKPHTCKTCGKGFDAPAYLNRKFCSLNCAYQDKDRIRSVIQKRKPRPKKGKTLYAKPCQQCGKEFKCNLARVSTSRFCSLTCYHAWFAKQGRPSGDKSPFWKGGFNGWRGPNWKAQSRLAKIRDNYTCQRCGFDGSKKSRSLCVHHIKPFKHFAGKWERANKLSNLVTLCFKCHGIVERSMSPSP